MHAVTTCPSCGYLAPCQCLGSGQGAELGSRHSRKSLSLPPCSQDVDTQPESRRSNISVLDFKSGARDPKKQGPSLVLSDGVAGHRWALGHTAQIPLEKEGLTPPGADKLSLELLWQGKRASTNVMSWFCVAAASND